MQINITVNTQEILFKEIANDIVIYCLDNYGREYVLAEVIIFDDFVRVFLNVSVEFFKSTIMTHKNFKWNWNKIEYV